MGGGRGGVLVHHYFLKKNCSFSRDLNTKKIVIFGRKLPLRLDSDSKKKICAHAQSSFELPIPIPIPIPIPSKFSEKRMTHSPIPIPSGLKGMTTAGMVPYNWDSSPSCNCGPNFVSVGITNLEKEQKAQKTKKFLYRTNLHGSKRLHLKMCEIDNGNFID